MKTVYKMIGVFSLVAFLAGLECIMNSSCKFASYSQKPKTKILDNSRIEEKKELTLMVYMAADNDLESYALQNLKAMERADFSGLNVLVLLDRSENYDQTNEDWTDTRLFMVQHDSGTGSNIVSKRLACPQLGLTEDSETELDMGNHTVLKAFVEFARCNYQTDRYALIIWGHGSGWRYSCPKDSLPARERAVAIDDKSHSYICVKDLRLALQDQALNLIGFDTCFGSVFENLYELKDCAEYIAASPGLTPAAGWNYRGLLEGICKSDFSSRAIAETIKDSSSQAITITESSSLQNIMNDIETFSKALSATIYDYGSRLFVLDSLINTKSYSYTQFPCDMYLDIFSMAQTFIKSPDEELKRAAEKLAASTTNIQTGIHFIPKNGESLLAASHSPDYLKNDANTSQCLFIKESQWWVPTLKGNSESLLDKLFYWTF